MSNALPIKNFPGYYVTDSGDVYSRRAYNNPNGRIKRLKPLKAKDGYEKICLWRNGVQSTYQIHRLVAMAFIKNPNNKSEVNHKNGIRNDNRAENLEWITHRDNIIHSYNVLKRLTRLKKNKD